MTKSDMEIVAYVLAKCRAHCEPDSFEHIVAEFCHTLGTLNERFNEHKFRQAVARGSMSINLDKLWQRATAQSKTVNRRR